MSDNKFYGWYDDPGQAADSPSYDPPHDAPCLFCGHSITYQDIRTHSIMYAGKVYAKRSYFYRTHASCAKKHRATAMDVFIFEMIERNGD